MKWTFGIITDGKAVDRVNEIICSIKSNFQDDSEIIVVGGEDESGYKDSNVCHCSFDETKKEGWITKKKNLVAEVANNENLCILHDYVKLCIDWSDGFDQFGEDWLTCTNMIFNNDGQRFRDWCVIYNDAWMDPPIDDQEPPGTIAGRLLSYDKIDQGRWQYYSGAYFCCKREVLLSVPLNENRGWGQGEDVEWCRNLYKKYGDGVFNFNPHSTVSFLKQKEYAPWERLPELQ